MTKAASFETGDLLFTTQSTVLWSDSGAWLTELETLSPVIVLGFGFDVKVLTSRGVGWVQPRCLAAFPRYVTYPR